MVDEIRHLTKCQEVEKLTVLLNGSEPLASFDGLATSFKSVSGIVILR
jgi:hypothetical protein